MENISNERDIRIEKVKELKEKGINPYPNLYKYTDNSSEIKDRFEKYNTSFKVNIAGRVMLKRVFGKALFMTLRDFKGDIQIYGQSSVLNDDYELLKKKVDTGDIIGVEGEVFKTHKGEITVNILSFKILSKCINPLPEKFHGITDIELKYRQRYLDMIINTEVKDRFFKRGLIIKEIREFLYERGFIEVETPVLQPIPGGARAKPFITHHNALNMDLYLRIAPELYLKRIITGGIEKVFELGKMFRNEGISTRHNPEFTMLELYQAYADYKDMMEITEELISRLVYKFNNNSYVIEYEGKKYDFTRPWKRLTMIEAIKEYLGLNSLDFDYVKENAIKLGIPKDIVEKSSYYSLLNLMFEEFVESKLDGPIFITEYPAETSPLAKSKESDTNFVERFELFIAGREHANAYTELNDPIIQRERLLAQAKAKAGGDDEAMYFDEDFINALEYGMPPTGGLGIGIDRLLMILLKQPSIRDVIIFPHMKPLKEN
ncbi:MAG TPA: lysine--tRNA ligase [Spirochaetota bacterium]|nr:lysine--tRNA ligase [Spirochaetota bacterium]HOM39024.1 lysine--tRNA ligase [Spirochaetota bacterium]HPQ49923.1 lysine--tRNA ligase [Spirochaetota bacterium]